jgi:hypothetical protein
MFIIVIEGINTWVLAVVLVLHLFSNTVPSEL